MSKEYLPDQHTIDDLSRAVKLAIGATVVSMITSFSTHHITMAASGHVSPNDLSHAFEREREVLHGPSSLGRTRYPTVSGSFE